MREAVSRAELWRGQYRDRRYLEYLPQEQLDRRTADLLTNLCTLTPAGQIGLIRPDGPAGEWHERWTHILEEYALRYGLYPAGLSRDVIDTFQPPRPTYPTPPSGHAALARLGLERGQFLLKFGREEHLRPALEEGRLRIGPASSYDDASLNAAIQDDELSFETISHPASFKLEVLPRNGGLSVPIRAAGNLTAIQSSSTNYYVYCMSTAADHRLFDDFEANACLAIRQPPEFVRRLVGAVRDLLPGWGSGGGPITYADPHFTRVADVQVPMTKHFRFAYQWEYRVFWLPPDPRHELEPHFVTVGSLQDCAELVVL